MNDDELDLIVVGAGLRGLRAALAALRPEPTRRVVIVDGKTQPGGSVRTQRSNGFMCELGPFAFTRTEIDPLLELLPQPPRVLDCLPGAMRGQLVTPAEPVELQVDPVPVSFASGNEELPQACRRLLGPALRLGRDVVQIGHHEGRFVIELGGEVRHRLRTRNLTLAMPDAAAGLLLGMFDPALAAIAARCVRAPGAFAFFGGDASDAPQLRGYGMLPREDVDSPLAEVIFCSQVFPDRALPGRFLVRCELTTPPDDDHAAMALAEAELRRWTGLGAALPFTKLHRFEHAIVDGALVECRTRLRQLPARVPDLRLA